jgi:hypothetical protein
LVKPAAWCVVVLLSFLWVPGQANADVTVLLEEPYGYDGA